MNEFAIHKATCAETRRAGLDKLNTLAITAICFMKIGLKYVTK